MLLFLTGFLQVFLVSLNTYQIAHRKWVGAVACGFAISYVWAWNVTKVAFGCNLDKIIYALGASVGTVAGIWIAGKMYGKACNLR